MKILLTILVNILSFAFFAVVMVIPVLPQFQDDPRVNTYLAVILCNPNERLIREKASAGIMSSFGLSMKPTCINQQQRRDVTTRWLVIGLGGSGVLFLAGTILEILLVLNAIRRGVVRAVTPRSKNTVVPIIPTEATLTDKLRQLEDAHKAGLITYDEYDQKRQELLRKLS